MLKKTWRYFKILYKLYFQNLKLLIGKIKKRLTKKIVSKLIIKSYIKKDYFDITNNTQLNFILFIIYFFNIKISFKNFD